MLLAFLIPALADAAAPTNDICSGAEVIPFNATFPYVTAVTDITLATTNGDPPSVSCFFFTNVSRSIWYVFTPQLTALYTISSCADAPTATTVPDTVMAIYTSSGGCGGTIDELPSVGASLGCDDDSCGPGFSQASITSQLLADTTYYVVVWQYGTNAPNAGNSSVQLRISKTIPPANDTGASAIEVFANLPVIGSTILAHNDYQLPPSSTCFANAGQIGQTASQAAGRDVVYSFTALAAGIYSIKVGYYNNSDPYDLVVYAASALPSGPFPATVTTCLGAANRSAFSQFEEIFSLPLALNQKIYIVVDEDVLSPQGSSFLLEVTRCFKEAEPNNTIAGANPFVFGIEGSISPGSDIDVFSLGAFPTNSRAFVQVDGSAANITDFDLRLTTDTGALIEYDDADNDEAFGSASPNIAGAVLTGAPALLRVNSKPNKLAEPYRIYAVIQPPLATATVEVEPNDSVGQFNEAPNNYFYGTLRSNLPPAAPSPSTDVDVYRFDAEAGTLLFLSLDGNPLRGSKPINAKLELLDGDGNLLIKVDDGSANSPASSLPPGEALVYRVENDGYYFARVSASPLAGPTYGAGDYLLSISKNGFIGACGCNNAPALASASITGPVYANSQATLSGTIVDYDIGQWHQVIINWGDGSPATTNKLGFGIADFNASHVFTQSISNQPISIVVRDDANASATTNLTVVVQPPPASAQLIVGTPLPNGHVPLQLQGTPGIIYHIESSPDLRTWTNMIDAPVGSNGLFQTEDSAPSLSPQRFYRGTWP